MEALQNGDRKPWSALFEHDAELYDNGSLRSLEEFTRDALGASGSPSIDRIENFRFQLSSGGKIKRLDIAQAR